MPKSSGSRSSGLIHRQVPPAVNDTSESSEIDDIREAPAISGVSESFEISDTWDAPAVTRVATPAMVERPKSARQARRFLLIRMFAFGWVRCKCRDISLGELVPL
jgi:hypothetical protein